MRRMLPLVFSCTLAACAAAQDGGADDPDGGDPDVGGAGGGAAGAAGHAGSGGTGGGAGGAAAGATGGAGTGGAGGRAGAGGGGAGGGPARDAGAPPDVAPVGCGQAEMCLDFESGALPNGWSFAENTVPRVDNSRPHSGQYSLHYTLPGGENKKGHITTTAFPKQQGPLLYVRYWMYQTGATGNFGFATYNLRASGTRVGGGDGRYMQRINNGRMQGAYAQGSAETMYTSECAAQSASCTQQDVTRTSVPLNQWVCIEATLDGLNGLPVQVSMNGAALKLAAAQAAWPKLSAFTRLDVGYEEWHLNDAKQVWIDDVAVSSRPVGCN